MPLAEMTIHTTKTKAKNKKEEEILLFLVSAVIYPDQRLNLETWSK